MGLQSLESIMNHIFLLFLLNFLIACSTAGFLDDNKMASSNQADATSEPAPEENPSDASPNEQTEEQIDQAEPDSTQDDPPAEPSGTMRQMQSDPPTEPEVDTSDSETTANPQPQPDPPAAPEVDMTESETATNPAPPQPEPRTQPEPQTQTQPGNSETEDIIREASKYQASVIKIVNIFITSKPTLPPRAGANYRSPAMQVLDDIKAEGSSEYFPLNAGIFTQPYTSRNCSDYKDKYDIETVRSNIGLIVQEYNYICLD